MEYFQEIADGDWTEVFFDPGTENWREKWTLDGEKAELKNEPDGMHFAAGPTFGDDADHAVLWTKDSFQGDLKIEFDYTRLDDATKCVNIIYIQATGSGAGPYHKDISRWADLRRVPAMRLYFQNMNTYHISFAAFTNVDGGNKKDYIRARRYLPEAQMGLQGTDLEPDYSDTGFFAKGVPHHVTILKKGQELLMRIRAGGNEKICHWKNDSLPDITEGRIGLRHMHTRSAVYANIRISESSFSGRQ